MTRPTLPKDATAEQYEAYVRQSQAAAAIDKTAIDAYAAPLIVTPLLGALLIYSGIKVAGDVAMSNVLKTRQKVDAP